MMMITHNRLETVDMISIELSNLNSKVIERDGEGKNKYLLCN